MVCITRGIMNDFDLGEALAEQERATVVPIKGRKSINSQPTNKPMPAGRNLKELKGMFSEKVSWVWRDHFPQGLPSLINGREGVGKTSISMQAGKEITEQHPEGTVVWLASEGAVADTVAKMEELQVNDRFVVAQKSDGTFKWNFIDRRELKELETLLDSLPQPILAVFVDSLRGITPYDDNESKIKNVMQALNAICCDKYKAALIYIHHFSKGKKSTLLDQSTGSTAITSSVRVVLSVLPVSAFKRTIKQAKSNISGNRPELEAIKIGNRIIINEPAQKSEDTLTTQAEEFLLSLFDKRTKIPAKEIYEKGEALEFSSTLLKNVKKTLGIEATNDGFGTPWFWHWPLYKGKADSRGFSRKGGDVTIRNHIEGHESHENLENKEICHESHESHYSHESQLKNNSDSNKNNNNNINIPTLPKNTPEHLVGKIDPELAKEVYGNGD